MRYAGILLHIASLPNEYGIGTLGKESYQFVDFLKSANQKFWQVLPIGPTSYGDSPYQSFSVFAGNPYFIDFDLLKDEGLLQEEDYFHLKTNSSRIDYHYLFSTRFNVLYKAYEKFLEYGDSLSFNQFKEDNKDWLDDYALYMTIKETFNYQSWQDWPIEFKIRNSLEVFQFEKNNKKRIDYWRFIQFLFFKQWHNLKNYANSNQIEIIGDMPIYTSLDSADCWANPHLWQLDENFVPEAVAGVPPDLFSKTGQLWGNPLYDFHQMEKDNYSWWKQRIKHSLTLFDVIRIDHFRGFESYYSIPYPNQTAQNGVWVKGPGIKLFSEIKKELGDVRIIAEDLGYITDDVKTLLKQTTFPGMKVLQFGFDCYGDSEHAPHNLEKNYVIYPGTHDNPPIKAWYESLNPADKKYVNMYLCINDNDNICEVMIKECLKSVCKWAIIPIQDYLELGIESRINTPSTSSGNWQFRLKKEDLSVTLANKIKQWTNLYRRGFSS